MERNVSRTSLFDCQRPLTLLRASRRRPKFNTQLSSSSSTVLSAQLRAAQPANRFGVKALVASAAAPVASARKLFPRTFSQESFGGGEGVRTPDLRLAKPALCQLSYAPKASGKGWLRGRDLNPRPLGYEPNELPDCSTPRHPNN